MYYRIHPGKRTGRTNSSDWIAHVKEQKNYVGLNVENTGSHITVILRYLLAVLENNIFYSSDCFSCLNFISQSHLIFLNIYIYIYYHLFSVFVTTVWFSLYHLYLVETTARSNCLFVLSIAKLRRPFFSCLLTIRFCCFRAHSKNISLFWWANL